MVVNTPPGVFQGAASAFPRRAAHVVERLVDGELVLYDGSRGRVHALNSTASFVWRLCDGAHAPAGIAAQLAEFYPESAGAVSAHVTQLLATLWAERLLDQPPALDSPQ